MTEPHLKILKLTAENVLGIRVVEIEPSPDGSLVIIGGKNGQGKTSVLNSIWLALGGAAASRSISDPLHHGADAGQVTVDLGEFTVTRIWDATGKSKLEVRSAAGQKFQSPQAMLDSFIGKISFDPMAFLRLRSNEQVATLLSVIDLPIDLDDYARMRQGYYDERTDIGRTVRSLQGQLDGMLPIDEGVPDHEIDVTVLVRELDSLLQANQQREQAVARAESLETDLARAQAEVNRLRADLAVAEAKLIEVTDEATAAAEYAASLEAVDATHLRGQIDSVQTTNERVRANVRRREVAAELATAQREYEARTEQIDDIDRARAEALAAATMPLDGLGLTVDGADSEVTYNGVVLGQCSGAEQLRVAISMAMALNPTVRVILVTDGSLLDDDNLALISSMAADGDYQVWIERVGSDDDMAVIIEDGEVAA